MRMITTGEVDVGSVDPFVRSLRKDPFILKTGLHCLPFDLFVRSLIQGESIKVLYK